MPFDPMVEYRQLISSFFGATRALENPEVDEAIRVLFVGALQRAYDAGQPDAFARGFAAGIERAMSLLVTLARADHAGEWRTGVEDARQFIIDLGATSPAAAPVELPKDPTLCKRPGCAKPLAYPAAEYCGAACSAQRDVAVEPPKETR